MLLVTDFLLVTGFVVILLIILMLLNAKQKGQSQKLLIAFFVVAFLLNLDYYASLHKFRFVELSLFLVISGFEYLLGPLILFYIQSLFYKIRIRPQIYHFIPFIIYEILFILPYFYSVLKKEYVFDYLKFLDNNFFRYYLNTFFLVGYTLLALAKFIHYQRIAKDKYSSLDNDDLNWVKRLLIGTLIVLVLDIIIESFSLIYELNYGEMPWDLEYITAFAIVVLMGYLGYYGLRRSRVLVPLYLLDQNKDDAVREDRQETITFDNAEIEVLKNSLYKSFAEDKIYLDESLTLSTLASKLSTTDKRISFFLNHYLHVNFYDYVNKFRVDDMIEKIKSGKYEHYTLMGIAFESGFKSKTSFNRIFKKETGLTPSEYKKQQLENEAPSFKNVNDGDI